VSSSGVPGSFVAIDDKGGESCQRYQELLTKGKNGSNDKGERRKDAILKIHEQVKHTSRGCKLMDFICFMRLVVHIISLLALQSLNSSIFLCGVC
jgi:hypothetical protein